MNEKPNDFEEQYLLLEEEEEKENKKKLIILIILFILIIITSIIGATFSYEKYKHHHKPTVTCTINCDTNGDKKPDINIDYEGDGYAHFNVDTDGDLKADFNLMNQDLNNDGRCDLNCDNNKDGYPDFNIDLDGDGVADLNIKEEGRKLTNMDTNGDGICDVKCNGITDEAEDITEEDAVLTIDYHDDTFYYIGYTKTIIAHDIIPGWNKTVQFKIVNKSSKNAYYRMRWLDIINTITEENNITYSISKDNKMIIDDEKAPYENEELFHKVLIPPKTTYTYKLKLEFKETYVDQSVDKNKEFKATLKINPIG